MREQNEVTEALYLAQLQVAFSLNTKSKLGEIANEILIIFGDKDNVVLTVFLKITGRKKEIIVLSNGKNVAPALVEKFVKESYLISQCFVSGDGKNYCVTLITLNQTEAEAFARTNKNALENFADLIKSKQIFDSIEKTVSKANAKLSSPEQIKKFMILERDFSTDISKRDAK